MRVLPPFQCSRRWGILRHRGSQTWDPPLPMVPVDFNLWETSRALKQNMACGEEDCSERDNEVSFRSAGHSLSNPFQAGMNQRSRSGPLKNDHVSERLLLVIALGSDHSWCAIAWLVNPRVPGFSHEAGIKRPFNFRVINRRKCERSVSESPSWTPAIFLLSPTVV